MGGWRLNVFIFLEGLGILSTNQLADGREERCRQKVTAPWPAQP